MSDAGNIVNTMYTVLRCDCKLLIPIQAGCSQLQACGVVPHSRYRTMQSSTCPTEFGNSKSQNQCH